MHANLRGIHPQQAEAPKQGLCLYSIPILQTWCPAVSPGLYTRHSGASLPLTYVLCQVIPHVKGRPRSADA
jgi:hypothetical protein